MHMVLVGPQNLSLVKSPLREVVVRDEQWITEWTC